MKSTAARILETRHWSDARLCRLIERFQGTEPTEDELAGVYDGLEQALGSDLHEMFAEQDSGIRAVPRPLPARPAEQPFEEKPRTASSEPIEPAGFWSNPTVSRTLAAFSMVAVLALVWARIERTEAPAASTPPAFEVRSVENSSSSARAPDPGALERRSTALPAPPPVRAADTESVRKPTARSRVASAPGGKIRTTPLETGGKLNINSIPLSKVVLDGRPLGETPRVEVAVAAGPHTVLFVHPELGRIQKDVYVDSGRTVLAAVRFD